jgi:superfamily II DNA or RNA helicase
VQAEELGPGVLARMRGREWIVLSRSEAGSLVLRPLGGGSDEEISIVPALEGAIEPSHFEEPSNIRIGPSADARLLRDAMLLSLRRGAGPFRSFGKLNFAPRAYQLAPLLMALRLDPIRLLIADDVGIGKTIEAGLIAREMLDRGEIRRLSVICPPHLVDQWVGELKTKFSIDAVGVTGASASRLEKGLRLGASLFEEHPFSVVSLDYIKRQERAAHFESVCPELVIVDEAHTCVGAAGGKQQQRYRLLERLSRKATRHILLLTATPHSGDASAFARLTGLLDPQFLGLESDDPLNFKLLRERLGDHLIQRRRPDIEAWREPGLFPTPEVKPDTTYRLHPEAARFFEAVLDYCAEVTLRAGGDERRRRLAFWGTLALMRCVASSPIAALSALRSRAGQAEQDPEGLDTALLSHAFDGEGDDGVLDDAPPPIVTDTALQGLLEQAETLALDPKKDAKLKILVTEATALVKDGFSPVIFCRYIGTAKGVGAALEAALPGVTVSVVTGELPSSEREQRVEELGQADKRILVATDCLSEGINLQSRFDAVVHYDLSWNPTRHQQREGRVNRFGQPKKVIRTLLIYGADNPVDGAVLKVILRKAEDIRKATGVPVPIPDDDRAMSEALLKAVLLQRKRGSHAQPMLFDDLPESIAIDQSWRTAAEREKQSRTIFAQRALKPENVLPEWEKARAQIGGDEGMTRQFLGAAFDRFGSPLIDRSGLIRLTIPDDPNLAVLAERLTEAGLKDGATFTLTPGPGREVLHRTHPLVSTVGEFLMERALDPEAGPANDISTLSRSGIWISDAVTALTTIAVLRLRHSLDPQNGNAPMLAEEASAIAWQGQDGEVVSVGADAFALLDSPATGEIADSMRRQRLDVARDRVVGWRPSIEQHARYRAEELSTDHDRVRRATMRADRTTLARIHVTPILPVDVIGLYVLMPPVT